jgi:SAM-dependent methyltransferase
VSLAPFCGYSEFTPTNHFSILTREAPIHARSANMRLNSFQGKRLLALARGGDYAHAGETESIDLVWNRLPKNPTLQVLDAGCGRGGTAAYIQRAGWGKVTGIDIEGESIRRAREVYPGITFDVCPVEQADRLGAGKFDVICCFNSFYAFSDQPAALRAFAHNGKPGAQLAIFEYTDPGTFKESALGQHVELFGWHPVIPSTIGALLNETGWKLDTVQDVTSDYIRWYKTFSDRIRELRSKLIEECGLETWEYASNFYDLMHETIKTGHMGGAIVYANRPAI